MEEVFIMGKSGSVQIEDAGIQGDERAFKICVYDGYSWGYANKTITRRALLDIIWSIDRSYQYHKKGLGVQKAAKNKKK